MNGNCSRRGDLQTVTACDKTDGRMLGASQSSLNVGLERRGVNVYIEFHSSGFLAGELGRSFRDGAFSAGRRFSFQAACC
jgi:hypothetical protein